jgi:hypothetical protein
MMPRAADYLQHPGGRDPKSRLLSSEHIILGMQPINAASKNQLSRFFPDTQQ